MEIKSTKRYSQFGTISGNRDINESHLRRLKRNIQKNNLLEFQPILVNEKMEVIDGQHRLAAAESLGTNIYYVVLSKGGMDEVTQLNSTQRGWTPRDYLESFVKRGYEEYLVLQEFCSQYNMTIGVARKLLGGKESNTKRSFQNGEFVVRYLDLATQIAKLRLLFLPFLDIGISSSEAFNSAMTHIVKRKIPIKQDILLEKLKEMNDKIHVKRTRIEYLREIEVIYNKGLKGSSNVRFF